MFKVRQQHLNGQHILYDAVQLSNIESNWFDSSYWQNLHCITGLARGRASTVFFSWQQQIYVLRHYHRGGLAAKFVRNYYLWTGLERTRAWREWHLLAKMARMQLPVPAPVAARVTRRGFYYQADLITQKIGDSVSLSQILINQSLTDMLWRKLGEVLAQFHNAGIYHADLNAHNILFSGSHFFLIDFDRGYMRAIRKRWQQANLKRLLRSLRKLKDRNGDFNFTMENWLVLRKAYEQQLCV